MDLLYNVVLLQIAVLQQDLLERAVEEDRKRKRRKRPRRYQTHSWLAEERRRLYRHYDRLMEELTVEDTQSFFKYLRMEPVVFNELVQRVMGPRIEKHDTKTTIRDVLTAFKPRTSGYRQFMMAYEVHSS